MPGLHDAHDLMPPELAATLPKLYSCEKESDPIARVRYFTPDSSWTWWLLEFDPDERLCFGLVKGLETELGYFSLEEMESVKGPLGLKIERELHFQPKPLSQCRKDR